MKSETIGKRIIVWAAVSALLLSLAGCREKYPETPKGIPMEIVSISDTNMLSVRTEEEILREEELPGQCRLVSGWSEGQRAWYLVENGEMQTLLNGQMEPLVAADADILTADGERALACHIQWTGEADYDTPRTCTLLQVEPEGESLTLGTGIVDAVLAEDGKIAAQTEAGTFFILRQDGSVSEEQEGRPVGWRNKDELLVLRDAGTYKDMREEVWLYDAAKEIFTPLRDAKGEVIWLRHLPGEYITANENWLAYTAREKGETQYPVLVSLTDGRAWEMKAYAVPRTWQLYVHLMEENGEK